MPDSPTVCILDGVSLARALGEETRQEAARVAAGGTPPSLRIILVGEDPASVAYIASKTRAAREAGCLAETVRLPAITPPERLIEEIERANRDEGVDGVLVQLPLPPGHEPKRVFDALDPSKDVDGVHPENVGRLVQGRPRFVPCTAAGILALLDAAGVPITGADAVVLGRSEIVGKPVSALLTSRDATVTLCHSRSRNLASICRRADILVAAIGKPGFVTREFVKPGAAVVDVGINRIESLANVPSQFRGSARVTEALAAKGRALVGDVAFDDVLPVAGWITPVPGGVGPLTIAMLLRNTVEAARRRVATR
jgi:methylenetetrahydrofolate dehydrogenase (NADP+)/methenyltetrahydrofolate cyclohydrolase